MSYTTLAEIKRGELHRFPKSSIIQGLKYLEKPEQYSELRLFKDEHGYWWLYYSRYKKTGRFPSKRQAIGWFEKKGR